MRVRAPWRIALAALLSLAPALALAEPPAPLFAGDDLIHLTIQGPIGRIVSNRSSAASIDATLSVVGTAAETLPVKLTARGITRRATDTCQFPPLRVEFPQKPGEASLFRWQKKLKLVTHCRAATSFQHYPLLEYAAYRMFNLLTPASFRARLATIDYLDASGQPIVTRLGFFIEDVKGVARRNGLTEPKTPDRIPIAALDAGDAGRFAMFEYMIGNLDWAMNAGPVGTGCCHNARLIGASDTAVSDLRPVPYDFDFSGMVDAPYAVPPDGISLPNVRVRRYRGFCRHNAEAQAAAADMLAHRTAILAVLDGIPQLDETAKRKAQAYLGGFFDEIDTPQDVSAKILKTCI